MRAANPRSARAKRPQPRSRFLPPVPKTRGVELINTDLVLERQTVLPARRIAVGDARRIGDAYEPVERGRRSRRVNKRRLAKLRYDPGAESRGFISVPAHNCFGKIRQQAGGGDIIVVGNAGILRHLSDINVHLSRSAALTEHKRMRGGSVETLVKRRHPGRNHLNLRTRDRAEVYFKITDSAIRQIVGLGDLPIVPLRIRDAR